MFSHVPQIIIPAYLLLVSIGTPLTRAVLMRRKVKGFSPWSEFWKTWAFDTVLKIILVCVLYIGGFWN